MCKRSSTFDPHATSVVVIMRMQFTPRRCRETRAIYIDICVNVRLFLPRLTRLIPSAFRVIETGSSDRHGNTANWQQLFM